LRYLLTFLIIGEASNPRREMSKQLALSAAFSTLAMAIYVLFGTDAARVPLGLDSAAITGSPVEISAPELPRPAELLPSMK
jgi:hypothetical protein